MILTIDGHRFNDIAGFYAEVNRVFMAGEDWQLGDSLDALDDMLYGGFGALHGAGSARVLWRGLDKSAADLGLTETRRWLTAKLEQPRRFNSRTIRSQLDALDDGTGQTFFQIVQEIFASHAQIELIPG